MDIQYLLKNMLAEIAALTQGVSDAQAEALLDAIENAEKVFVSGAGRSGCIARAFAIRLLHMGIDVHIVGHAETPAAGPKDLLILVSSSGETKSLQIIAQMAKSVGASVAAVTGIAKSSLGKSADLLYRIPSNCCGKNPDGTVVLSRTNEASDGFAQPMGNAGETATLLALDAIGIKLMRRRNISEKAMNARHANLE